jgi:hypothetical protein
MNKQDKEAFDKWFIDYWGYEDVNIMDCFRSWKAGCEYYKQVYLNDCRIQRDMAEGYILDVKKRYEKLQAENKKLREVLEEISKSRSLLKFHDTLTKDAELAMKTLKEVGEE